MMRHSRAILASVATVASAQSLSDICSISAIQAALPSNGTLLGIDLIPSTVSADAVYNASIGGGMGMRKRQAPGSSTSTETYSYCNVTLAFTHTGKGDTVNLKYAFPEPSAYEGRYYVGGGGGYSLPSSTTGGLQYGAVSGISDGGYDAFDQSYDEAVLYGNGSINWDATYAFAYQAIGESTKVGKALAANLYGNSSKIYTYFEGCSDGGREGWSQIQHYGDEYDGVVAGAPAFRFAHQQVLHVYPATVEHIQGYVPEPCALQKIVNATIAACDPLDGRTDGVISRTDLCKLQFNLNTTIGEAYYCAAKSSSSLGFGFSKRQQTSGSASSTTPEQNGTITAEDVAVAQAVYDGLHNNDVQRAYISWQIGSSLDDAEPTYSNTTGWTLNIPSTGGSFVTKFVQLLDIDNLTDLDNVDYDTLVEWINIGMIRYLDSLQTTIPDISIFQKNGGKVIHYHGESDPSIPSASSVHYYDSVRQAMFPNIGYKESVAALDDFYRFWMVPGAAHCGVNSLQPGPYPATNMETIIAWVEEGTAPDALNATTSSGDFSGESQMLCKWPTRPYWTDGNSRAFECVYDQDSVDSWTYTFDAFKIQPIW